MILHSTPFEQGLGMAASRHTRIIQSYPENTRITEQINLKNSTKKYFHPSDGA